MGLQHVGQFMTFLLLLSSAKLFTVKVSFFLLVRNNLTVLLLFSALRLKVWRKQSSYFSVVCCLSLELWLFHLSIGVRLWLNESPNAAPSFSTSPAAASRAHVHTRDLRFMKSFKDIRSTEMPKIDRFQSWRSCRLPANHERPIEIRSRRTHCVHHLSIVVVKSLIS